jgi:hypothetical protein
MRELVKCAPPPAVGAGFPLQSFGGNGRRGAPATAKSISASIPSANASETGTAAAKRSHFFIANHLTKSWYFDTFIVVVYAAKFDN